MKRAGTTLILAAVLLAALLAGCGDHAPAAWIEACAGDSAAADRALADHDDAQAAVHLEAILAREIPGEVAPRDARIVRQDAYDRLAQIDLRHGDLARARERANQGVALGIADDVTSTSVLTTRGRILEAEGRDAEAVRDYHRALEITERLLDRALEGR